MEQARTAGVGDGLGSRGWGFEIRDLGFGTWLRDEPGIATLQRGLRSRRLEHAHRTSPMTTTKREHPATAAPEGCVRQPVPAGASPRAPVSNGP
jgi:hypothetical protein